MSLGMTDRTAAISDEHADDQTIFYTATAHKELLMSGNASARSS